MLSVTSGNDVVLIAFFVRLIAVVVVLLVLAVIAFSSGWVTFSPEKPGFARHTLIDWGCPACDVWGTAYVSRIWRERSRRRALALLHRKMSPQCPGSDRDLLILP
jgi:hypothetical protein